MRVSIKGAIRIPLRPPSFLFNDLVFLRIPRKSLKSLLLLFLKTHRPCSRPRGGIQALVIGELYVSTFVV